MAKDKKLKEFEDRMHGLQERVVAFTNRRYNPEWWADLLERYAAVDAIKKLLSEPVQYGFGKLWEYQALHLSVEHEILNPEYQGFFTESELSEARKRLDDMPDYPTRGGMKFRVRS
jgi:hypothetical protein